VIKDGRLVRFGFGLFIDGREEEDLSLLSGLPVWPDEEYAEQPNSDT
jgi:hypothetical protein